MSYRTEPVSPALGDGYCMYQGAYIISGQSNLDPGWDKYFPPGCVVGLDFETSGLGEITGNDYGASRWEPRCLTLASHAGEKPVVRVLDPRDERHREIARSIIERASELLIHNAPFDVPLIIQLGLSDIEVVEKVTDTLTLARLAFPGSRHRRDLTTLVEKFLKWQTHADNFGGDFFRITDIDSASYALSAAADTLVLEPLRTALVAYTREFLTTARNGFESGWLLDDGTGPRSAARLIEKVLIAHRVMLRATAHGYALDTDFARRYASEFEDIKDGLEHLMRLAHLGLDRRTTDNNLEKKWLAAYEVYFAATVQVYRQWVASGVEPDPAELDRLRQIPVREAHPFIDGVNQAVEIARGIGMLATKAERDRAEDKNDEFELPTATPADFAHVGIPDHEVASVSTPGAAAWAEAFAKKLPKRAPKTPPVYDFGTPTPAQVAVAVVALERLPEVELMEVAEHNPRPKVWATRQWHTGELIPEVSAWLDEWADIRDRPAMSLSHWLTRFGNLDKDFPLGSDSRPVTDKKELGGLRKKNRLVDAFITYQEQQRVLDAYLGKVEDMRSPVTGRIHPQIPVLGAATTGRMSAGTPPVQQFPGDARQMILADDPQGWVSIDWTSVEPMIAAYASGETSLVHTVLSGDDVYVPIAKAAGLTPPDLYGQEAKDHPGRKKAKTVLLALLYGNGAASLAHNLGVSIEEAKEIKAQVLQAVPRVVEWTDRLRNTAERNGMLVTAGGRVLEVAYDPFDKSYKGYQAQNYFHQGTGADLLMDTLVELHSKGLAHCVRLAMHDELVVDARYADEVAYAMEHSGGCLEAMFGVSQIYPDIADIRFPTDSNPLPERWLYV